MNNRPYKHIKAHKDGKKRDLNVCKICGSDKEIQGHHIIDYKHSGAANKDNIISLCKDCHHKVHKGLIDIYRF